MFQREIASILSIALIMAFRMLGLFMILPVFSSQAAHLAASNATLIGLALGIYGLTQAMLQIPFGMLSDRIGRKPVIALGLLLFTIGSVIAAMSHSIEGIIIGRAVQGAGAIGSTCLALLADLTRDENRSKAMATVGMTIGLSFSLAVIIGPIINSHFHLAGIFWATAGLALIALTLLFTTVPKPPKLVAHKSNESLAARYRKVFHNAQLLRCNFAIFSQHAILMALFIVIPPLLTHTLQLSAHQQTLLYLIVLAVAFIGTVPLIIIAEKKRQMKTVLIGAVACLTLSMLLLTDLYHSGWGVGFTLLLFFAAFTLLEACLPSLVSKIAPLRDKGTAMGVYSTSQFFGIFVGGSVGGLLYSHYSIIGPLSFIIALGVIWTLVTWTMKPPPYLSTMTFSAPHDQKTAAELATAMEHTEGVAEAALMPDENMLYLKVDKQKADINELRKAIEAGTLNEHYEH